MQTNRPPNQLPLLGKRKRLIQGKIHPTGDPWQEVWICQHGIGERGDPVDPLGHRGHHVLEEEEEAPELVRLLRLHLCDHEIVAGPPLSDRPLCRPCDIPPSGSCSALEDPWEETVRDLSEGKTYVGTISRLAQFGAFVTLGPGVDGLIHISKLGRGKRINHPREMVEEGQNMEVVIESIDPDNKRISLAPSDYVSAEDEADKEHKDYMSYRSNQSKSKTGKTKKESMGSFGALLKAKLEEKK